MTHLLEQSFKISKMQKQQKEKDYRPQLQELLQRSWKKILFTALINSALLWQSAVDWYFYINFNFLFARRAFFKRTTRRAHWVGHQVAKPHRLAAILLALVVLAGVGIAPHTLMSLYWIIAWGTIFSFWVTVKSLARIAKRIRI